MQLSFLTTGDSQQTEPTIAGLMVGTAFKRKGDRHQGYLYMLVNISPAIRWESKDDRDCVIVNLRTGCVFTVYGNEPIDPLPHAAVIEDQVKQLKKGK